MHGGAWRGPLALALVIGIASGLALARRSSADADMNGEWRFDPRRSDAPPMGGGFGRRGGPEGGGMRGGMRGGPPGEMGGGPPGGMGGGPPGGMGAGRGEWRGGRGERRMSTTDARPARLPELMHVTQAGAVVSFEDSTGHVVQEIALVDAKHDTLMHPPGAMVWYGAWHGDTLDVTRETPMGKTLQSWWLDPDGHALVQRTQLPGNGERPAMEFRRVYQRVAQP